MTPFHSILFDAVVEHRRLEPRAHSFRYRVRYFAFDLDELPELDRRLPLFSYNRWNLFSIHDEDYLDSSHASIREKLERHLHRAGFTGTLGHIVLVTSPRFLFKVFNPVSFYFLFDSRGDAAGLVAEVNNTFGERHLYVLTDPEVDSFGAFRRYVADKVFHVSPFNDMEGRYEFLVQDIRKELRIQIRLWRKRRVVFEASLEGQPLPLTTGTLLREGIRHPTIAHQTMPRILWQASRLYQKRKLPVYSKPVARHPWTLIKNPPSVMDRRFQKWFLEMLTLVRQGSLKVSLPDGSTRYFGLQGSHPDVSLQIVDPKFFRRVFLGGDVGLGEAFMEGAWDTSDLTAFITLLIVNRELLEGRQSMASRLLSFTDRWRHLARANTLRGSRRNIRRHYDLSNDLFAAFLDPSMTYSCAVFERDDEDLETAQLRKLRRIIRKARIGPGDHVLEIGCGWGSFAIVAARETGCRVTGITVPAAQRHLATERVRQERLEDQITILLTDYRRVAGRFDRIISIEMLEAVGHEHYPEFFSCCERLLAPNGLIVLQTIALPDHRYETYRKGCDWIQKYIFPGGLLPSLSALCTAMAASSRFYVESLENIGIHYARTLRAWRERFLDRWDTIRTLGFDENFRRMWLYYLSFCEAAFATRTLNDLQIVLSRPGNPTLNRPG